MKERGVDPETAAVGRIWTSRSYIHGLVLMALTVTGIYLCCRMALPFLSALVWALALAALFAPLQRWLESKTRRPSLAAVLTLLAIGLIVVLPATLIVKRLIPEAARGADLIREKVQARQWRQVVQSHPRLAPLADWIEQPDVTETAGTIATWATTAGTSLVKGSVTRAIDVVLTFYLLFFFLRDRRSALQTMRSLLPLSDEETGYLFDRVANTIYATFYGTVAVAVVQGTLGGLMFWWLGLPAALLWGTVMTILAMVPLLGTTVVWGPAAIFLLIDDHWIKALILVIWGSAVVGTVDNILRPILVGRRLNLHTVVAFISVLGGLIVFGATGLILGPLVLTITVGLLEIWRTRTTVPPAVSGRPGTKADQTQP